MAGSTKKKTDALLAQADTILSSVPTVEENVLQEQQSIEIRDMPRQAFLFAPITRIDRETWEVEGVATSEEIDSFGTIFSYEASKRAFQNWSKKNANVREMHERRAVGKGIHWYADDATRQVIVRTRVSRGAPDTWQKVLDDVLCGYSVGATRPKWSTIERNGKSYPYLVDYDLAELSLVDSPSNPDCQIALARVDDENLSDVVDLSVSDEEETPPITPETSETIERLGARLSGATQQAMHEAIESALSSALSMMATCRCESCLSRTERMTKSEDERSLDATYALMTKRLAEELRSQIGVVLSPPTQRLNAIAGSLARSYKDPTTLDLTPIQAMLTSIETRLAAVPTQSSLDEVRAELSAVRDRVDVIAEQPSPGGPVLNAGVVAVEKRFASDLSHQNTPANYEQTLDVFKRMSEAGAFTDIHSQVSAAAAVLAAQQTRR